MALDGTRSFQSQDARMNVLMQCLGCAVPGHLASPNARRVHDRILYHLITKGVVRVGYRIDFIRDLPREILLDEMTNAHQDSARNYIGQAVRGIKGMWVSTHVHPGSGYILGHLRTKREPCHCKMM